MKTKITNVDVESDPCWTLEEWRKFINKLIKEHGKETRLFTDAGYNNVSLVIEKKQPLKTGVA